MGRQPSRGAPTYDFVKFSEKLHEIEKFLGLKGRHSPPLNPALVGGKDLCREEQIKFSKMRKFS